MNIWMINQYNMPPELGSLNRHYNFAKYLQRMGHYPTVFVGSKLHNSNDQMIAGREQYIIYDQCQFPYVFIKTCDYQESKLKRIYSMFEFYFRMLRYARNFPKPDVIIGSSVHPLACLAAIKLAKRYGCQSIVEIRDLWPESFAAYGILKRNNPLMKLLYAGERWLYKKADKLIFTMEGGRDYIIEKGWDTAHGGPVDLGKVYHINNGVDLEAFNYNREHYTMEDADLDAPDVFKVVYTGSVRKVNHVGSLVEAANVLQKRSLNKVKIIVYGDGDERKALEAEAKARCITTITFKGRIEKSYIPYVLSKADATIIHGDSTHLLDFGMSANKLFDYFAAGKPIVQDFKTGYDLVEKYDCGISRHIDTPVDFAEAIQQIVELADDDYMRLSDNAREAANDYDFKRLTEKLTEVINA